MDHRCQFFYSWTDHVLAPVTEHLGSGLRYVDRHIANACKTT